MRNFPFGQAVLAGFDLLRRRPAATLGVALVGVVVSLTGRVTAVVTTHVMVAMLATPGAAALNSLWAAGVNILVSLFVLSIIVAAVARQGRPRLGGDEARLFILSLLVVPGMLVSAAVGAVGATISVLSVMDSNENELIVASAFGLGAILALGLASRLWLAGPMSVAEGRLRLMASWRLTRGRSWKVFGAYLTTLLMAGTLAALGARGLFMVFEALKLNVSLLYDPSLTAALGRSFGPAAIGLVLLQGLLVGLAMILHAAAAVLIHRRLAGDPAAEQVAAFD